MVFAGSVLKVEAQIEGLTNGNSVAQIDVGSVNGMFNWSINGINQVFQQSLFYRVGDGGPELPISTISSAVISAQNLSQFTATYNSSQINVQVKYQLTGSTPSGFNQTIRMVNNSSTNIDVHFFEYSDFDLGGTAGGQSVSLLTNNSGFYGANQTGGGASIAMESVGPAANHGEAGFYNSTLVKLTNPSPDQLNDNLSVGPGDVTFALEWDFLGIAPGGTTPIISKIETVTVPEPSAAALLAAGIIGAAISNRRKQKI